MYIESRAYVSNLRQKLVCGSPLLAPRMHYYEWYSRALVPGTHFVQVMLAAVTSRGLETCVQQHDNRTGSKHPRRAASQGQWLCKQADVSPA